MSIEQLWSNSPTERLQEARQLEPDAECEIQRHLSLLAPVRPWPYGMPTSISPWIVLQGASPGGSPHASDHTLDPTTAAYGPPTVGVAHGGLFYRDGTPYWDKVRRLATATVGQQAATLSASDCLALTGQLNLGLARRGDAAWDPRDGPITSWVSRMLAESLRPRLVVGVGLTTIARRNSEFRRVWASGPLRVDWEKPDRTVRLGAHEKYRFQLWRLRRADVEPLLFVMWPNHPSRHPFADRTEWQASIDQFVQRILPDELAAPRPTY